MFENLIESKPKKVRTFKQSAMSLILHLTIGYVAIRATAGAAEELTKVLQDTTAFVLNWRRSRRRRRPRSSRRRTPSSAPILRRSASRP